MCKLNYITINRVYFMKLIDYIMNLMSTHGGLIVKDVQKGSKKIYKYNNGSTKENIQLNQAIIQPLSLHSFRWWP